MDRAKEPAIDRPPSDKSVIEQTNIRMDREFYGATDIEHPEETTAPFINRNQS